MKQAVVRQANGITASCDPGGNIALIKFSTVGAPDTCLILPSTVVYWLIENLPVNQIPDLQPPPMGPRIVREDWDLEMTPHVLAVQASLADPLSRFKFEVNRRPHVTMMLDRSHIEMLRQLMELSGKDLVKLDL